MISKTTLLLAAFLSNTGIAWLSTSIPRRTSLGSKRFLFTSDDDEVVHCKLSRRDVLFRWTPSVATLAFTYSGTPHRSIALAAEPITVNEVQNVGSIIQRAIRPKPPKVLRPKLDKDFAVLLMRSSYDALDALDCVAMDQFQRDFFIIRRAEYEPYVQALGPGFVQQGDLTDPFYFDFISFAQYKTIDREITNNPPFVFEEKQPVQVGDDEPQKFITALVKRDPAIRNDMLAPEHSRIVGAKILDKFETIFGDTPAALPKLSPGSRPDAVTLLASLGQMVKLFLVNGFAWNGSARIVTTGSGSDASGTKFALEMVSPATIWGGKALQIQRSVCSNDFVLKTAAVLISRLGYEVASPMVDYEGTVQHITFSVR